MPLNITLVPTAETGSYLTGQRADRGRKCSPILDDTNVEICVNLLRNFINNRRLLLCNIPAGIGVAQRIIGRVELGLLRDWEVAEDWKSTYAQEPPRPGMIPAGPQMQPYGGIEPLAALSRV